MIEHIQPKKPRRLIKVHRKLLAQGIKPKFWEDPQDHILSHTLLDYQDKTITGWMVIHFLPRATSEPINSYFEIHYNHWLKNEASKTPSIKEFTSSACFKGIVYPGNYAVIEGIEAFHKGASTRTTQYLKNQNLDAILVHAIPAAVKWFEKQRFIDSKFNYAGCHEMVWNRE